MSTQDEKPTKALAPHLPIEPLRNEVARFYIHLHPVLVLALFLNRFSSTVADPVSSLAQLIVPLCTLQAVYLILCLPPAPTDRPSPTAQSAATSRPGQQQTVQRGRKTTAPKPPSKTVPANLSILLSLVISTPILTTLLILHGAPLTTHLLQTLLAGAHLSLLATVPLFYTHGVSAVKWRALVSLSTPIDEVTGAALGTLFGAWLGAIPIPLDWDREWQKWPVTILCGAYAGWAVGKVIGGTLLKGKMVEFDE